MGNPWLTTAGRKVLEAEIDALVRETLHERLSASTETASAAPQVTAAVAAAKVVEQLELAHESELWAGEADLAERLAARLGPDVIQNPRVMEAVQDVVDLDRRAHTVARGIVLRDLTAAFESRAGERHARADKVLEAERSRIEGRAGGRVPRAMRLILAAVRLPDDAYGFDEGGARVAEAPATRPVGPDAMRIHETHGGVVARGV